MKGGRIKEPIIENGKRIIPHTVRGMWDDSIEELSAVFANSEDEAIELAKDYILECVYALDSERRTYRRDKCGTFRVYEVSIPYSDIIGEGEEAYTENPYTEYEEWEWYNALKED